MVFLKKKSEKKQKNGGIDRYTLTGWTRPPEVGKGRIRTYEEKISTELQSAAFSHSATLPPFALFLRGILFLVYFPYKFVRHTPLCPSAPLLLCSSAPLLTQRLQIESTSK